MAEAGLAIAEVTMRAENDKLRADLDKYAVMMLPSAPPTLLAQRPCAPGWCPTCRCMRRASAQVMELKAAHRAAALAAAQRSDTSALQQPQLAFLSNWNPKAGLGTHHINLTHWKVRSAGRLLLYSECVQLRD